MKWRTLRPCGRYSGLAATAMLAALVLLVAACGGGDKETPTLPATAAPTPTKAATPGAASPAPGAVTLRIASVGNDLKFDQGKLTVKAGASVRLQFDNKATALQHNWVLVQKGTELAVAEAGTAAGAANGWLPRGDARVMANTPLLDPGKSGEATFQAPPPGTYGFICSFPGHAAGGMVGAFEVTP